MKTAGVDYRIWKNNNFIIESNIITSLWDQEILNDFHDNLNLILDDIYKKSNSNFFYSKNLISLSFSGDKNIIELNEFYRKLKTPTNVLSFPSHSKFNDKLFLGDIIFSSETICREAKRDKKSIRNHLIHLFIHGVLHLLGYDHETDAQAKSMENLEVKILKTLKINNPYNLINNK